jgi:KH domain
MYIFFTTLAGGEMIRELQAKSHAKIQVDHTNRAGMAPDQKRVSITGSKDAVVKAREMVRFLTSNPLMEAQQALNMLINEKARSGVPWGTGPPYMNLPNQGFNMQPNGTPAAAAGPPSNYGGGGGDSFGRAGGNATYRAPTAPVAAANPHNNMYPPQQQQPFYSPAQELVYVQKQYMGRLIGAKVRLDAMGENTNYYNTCHRLKQISTLYSFFL